MGDDSPTGADMVLDMDDLRKIVFDALGQARPDLVGHEVGLVWRVVPFAKNPRRAVQLHVFVKPRVEA